MCVYFALSLDDIQRIEYPSQVLWWPPEFSTCWRQCWCRQVRDVLQQGGRKREAGLGTWPTRPPSASSFGQPAPICIHTRHPLLWVPLTCMFRFTSAIQHIVTICMYCIVWYIYENFILTLPELDWMMWPQKKRLLKTFALIISMVFYSFWFQ